VHSGEPGFNQESRFRVVVVNQTIHKLYEVFCFIHLLKTKITTLIYIFRVVLNLADNLTELLETPLHTSDEYKCKDGKGVYVVRENGKSLYGRKAAGPRAMHAPKAIRPKKI